jgi:hypothetical protein
LQEQLDQFAQAINQGAEQRQQSTSERVERLQEQLLQIAQIVNQEARQRQQFDTDLMLRLQEQQQLLTLANNWESEQQKQQRIEAGLERLLAGQQDLLGLSKQLNANLDERLYEQQKQLAEIVNQETEQKQKDIQAEVDRLLTAQRLGLEQLLNQYAQLRAPEPVQIIQPPVEVKEVQAEVHWDKVAEMLGKTLDERLTVLKDAFQRSVKSLEQEIMHSQHPTPPYQDALEKSLSGQEVLRGIEQLEHIVESMQVAMTANHALLSNRLYHHQYLPLERAHPAGLSQVEHPASPSLASNGTKSLLAQAKERVAQGLEPDLPVTTKE